MKLIIDIDDETYNDIQSRDWKNGEFIFSEEWKAIHNGISVSDNATNIEDKPQGEWLRVSMDLYVLHASAYYKCSICAEKTIGETKYCPHCGSLMMGKER